MNRKKKIVRLTQPSFFNQTKRAAARPVKDLGAIIATLAGSQPVYAAGGLARVTTTINNLQSFMQGLALAVVTIAFMWAGYKWLFKHATIDSLMPVIGGGILIGGAVEFSSFLVG